MKLNKISQIEDFLAAVNACKGDVTLTSPYGEVKVTSPLQALTAAKKSSICDILFNFIIIILLN